MADPQPRRNVFVKFFEDARSFTEEQIAELKAHRLLREDPAPEVAAKPDAPAAQAARPAITPTQPAPAAVPSPSKES